MFTPLRFHWRLIQGGETAGGTRASLANLPETGLPDLENQVEFCRHAEECGIDSLLTAFGFYMPDPMILAAALGMATRRIRFMIAYRSGAMSPTLFVQQLNTLCALLGGRVCLNIVAGHSPGEQHAYGDYLSHDERYARTAEFLAICHALWRQRNPLSFEGKYYHVENARLNTPFVSDMGRAPEIFIGGNSDQARGLAIEQGSCWLRFADTPCNLRPAIQTTRATGTEVALRIAIVARPTREEAVRAAYALLETGEKDRATEKSWVQASDSATIQADLRRAEETDWLTPYLWVGAVRTHGVATAALVGSPDEIADGIMEYKRAGVSQFVLSGWPKLDEMLYFGREVLPRIRAREQMQGVNAGVLTGSIYDSCIDCCGNHENPGVGLNVPEVTDYSLQNTSVCQSGIEDFLAHEDLAGKTILHVGVGNSGFAERFEGQAERIDGITVCEAELQRAASLALRNYRALLVNKYGSEFPCRVTGRYDFIVDNNLAGFACCKFHFFAMLDNYLSRLNPGGRILTHQRGMEWVLKDPRWRLRYEDLVRLERCLPVRVTRLTDSVYGIALNGGELTGGPG